MAPTTSKRPRLFQLLNFAIGICHQLLTFLHFSLGDASRSVLTHYLRTLLRWLGNKNNFYTRNVYQDKSTSHYINIVQFKTIGFMVNDHPSQDIPGYRCLELRVLFFHFCCFYLAEKRKNTKSVGTSGLRICHGQNMVYAIGYDHPTIIRDFLQWDVLGMLTPMNILLLEDDHHLSWENKPTFHISH